MAERVPLSALLSQALVAFTIELDNEFERQMPHRTTNHGRTAGSRHAPWLVSLAMWSNFLRFVDDDGIAVRELSSRPGVANWALAGMERWGYVTVKPDPADERPRPPRGDLIVRLRSAGRRARAIWQELPGVIEERWRARFGTAEVDRLTESLRALVARFDLELPHYLPGGGYEMFAELADGAAPAAGADRISAHELDLSILLSQVLLVFAVDYEREPRLSLALNANVIRVLTAEGVRVRDLPRLAGVAREAMSNMVGRLEKRGYVVVKPESAASRGKLVRLTAKGLRAQAAYLRRAAAVEELWRARFGEPEVACLRASLHQLTGEPGADPSPLWAGLRAPAGGWRASARKPDCLPHYPLVTHRGGFPDGS